MLITTLLPNKKTSELKQPEISIWRETEKENGITYGQNFLSRSQIESQFPEFELLPIIEFDLGNDFSHQTVLNKLKKGISNTQVALSESALKKSEGLVLRNENRSKIFKLRFDDYERTLR